MTNIIGLYFQGSVVELNSRYLMDFFGYAKGKKKILLLKLFHVTYKFVQNKT